MRMGMGMGWDGDGDGEGDENIGRGSLFDRTILRLVPRCEDLKKHTSSSLYLLPIQCPVFSG